MTNWNPHNVERNTNIVPFPSDQGDECDCQSTAERLKDLRRNHAELLGEARTIREQYLRVVSDELIEEVAKKVESYLEVLRNEGFTNREFGLWAELTRVRMRADNESHHTIGLPEISY